MQKVNNDTDAAFYASWTHTVRLESVLPLNDENGNTIAWTFATPAAGGSLRYGWVLPDGRVSPATEDCRSGAEDYARNTIKDMT